MGEQWHYMPPCKRPGLPILLERDRLESRDYARLGNGDNSRRSLLYKSNRALQLETLMRIYWIIIALRLPSSTSISPITPPPLPVAVPSLFLLCLPVSGDGQLGKIFSSCNQSSIVTRNFSQTFSWKLFCNNS